MMPNALTNVKNWTLL